MSAINIMKTVDTEKPLPLRKSMPPAEPFPVEAMGELLKNAALAIHDKVQAPLAICAQSVLAAATLAVQSQANVILPIGQTRPLSNFFLTIAASGERKTGCDAIALKAINEHEKKLFEIYRGELEIYQNAYDAWSGSRKSILSQKKKSKEEIKAQLEELGREPAKPILPLLTCSEPTFEGLVLQLAYGIPTVGIFSDEGGQFISGHGMNKDNKVKTISAFSKLWDGASVKRVRAGDGTTVLYGKRVCMHLMTQPDVANIILSDPMLIEQGFLSRVLVCYPETASGTRFSKFIKAETQQVLEEYNQRILDILQTPLPIKQDSRNELEPRELEFSDDAKKIWRAFSDHIERLIAPTGEMESIRGLANKLPEHAARLAGVLALFEDINVAEIDVRYIEGGIKLAQYYASEALRLFDQGRTDPNITKAERLVQWLNGNWQENIISPVEIYQHGVAGLTTKDAAMPIIKILEQHKYLIPLEGKHSVGGELRRQVWQIAR